MTDLSRFDPSTTALMSNEDLIESIQATPRTPPVVGSQDDDLFNPTQLLQVVICVLALSLDDRKKVSLPPECILDSKELTCARNIWTDVLKSKTKATKEQKKMLCVLGRVACCQLAMQGYEAYSKGIGPWLKKQESPHEMPHSVNLWIRQYLRSSLRPVNTRCGDSQIFCGGLPHR